MHSNTPLFLCVIGLCCFRPLYCLFFHSF